MSEREWGLYMDDVALLHICEHRLVAPTIGSVNP